MNTAILISGHMRSFDRCLPTLHWHVFRHFPAAHFYVSTLADEDAPKVELLTAAYGAERVHVEILPGQPDCISELRSRGCQLPPEWMKGKPYTHEPYAISVHPQAVARQLWQLEQAWNLYTAANRPAEVIIRCRPDLWFHSSELETPAPFPMPDSVASVPWWGRFGGINDRFAVLGATAAAAYFTTYSQIPEHLANGCPFHPESLIKASLDRAGCEIQDDGRYEFSTLRANGELRAPEISTQDLAHVALSR
jgi:hypothetical protein